jgi:hypothetical protein
MIISHLDILVEGPPTGLFSYSNCNIQPVISPDRILLNPSLTKSNFGTVEQVIYTTNVDLKDFGDNLRVTLAGRTRVTNGADPGTYNLRIGSLVPSLPGPTVWTTMSTTSLTYVSNYGTATIPNPGGFQRIQITIVCAATAFLTNFSVLIINA